jgi:hypothetical protein
VLAEAAALRALVAEELGNENHLIGFRIPPARAPTIRASVGVISGRIATSRPPLSWKL